MSKRFDPYLEWLNIPPDRRPPNFYDLLGLRKYESDQQTIQHAARERSLIFEDLYDGPRSQRAKALNKEVLQAFQILSHPARKAAYDSRLRHLESTEQTIKSSETFIESEESEFPDLIAVRDPSSEDRKPAEFPLMVFLICIALITLLAIAAIATLVMNFGQDL